MGPPRHAGGHHELLRPQGYLLALALDDHLPLAGRLVVARAPRGGGAPVVQLHHARVHLEPVGDLVLGREHRPVRRELDVRQVVVPDRVVQAQRLVAVAPRVSRAGVALDDDRRHPELAQPRPERDAALAAAHDHHVGLGRDSELLGLPAAILEPRVALRIGPVLDPLGSARAKPLLVPLELIQSGQQRPCLPVEQADMPAAAADLGLKQQPRLAHPIGLGGLPDHLPSAGLHGCERVLEHVLDAAGPLDRLDVPGERDQIAPVALGREQLGGAGGVTAPQRLVETREPLVDLGRDGAAGGGARHGLSSYAGGGRTNSRGVRRLSERAHSGPRRD
jgi:hypothetical protein